MSKAKDLICAELNQTYQIDELIGKGGMGEVYRGHNIETGEPVAIKILLQEFAKDELYIGLFRKEARILHHLAHDAIVRYFSCSTDRDLNLTYLAMELVDGPSLADILKQGPLAPEDIARLKTRLADSMQKAHLAGVFHRDLSPDNIIMPASDVDKAKIIDFGIARSNEVGGETLLGGNFAGKYGYVAPEQLGMFGGQISAQSDIYSLGLVLAAALRGKAIDMSGTQVDVVEKRRLVPDLSDIPPQFHDLLTAMLQSDPAARPKSMAEVRDWKIGEATASDPDRTMLRQPLPPPRPVSTTPQVKNVQATEKSVYRPPEPAPKKGWGMVAALAVLGLTVVGAGVLGGLYFVEQGKPELDVAVSLPPADKPSAKVDDEPPDLPAPSPVKPVEVVKPVEILKSETIEIKAAQEQTQAVEISKSPAIEPEVKEEKTQVEVAVITPPSPPVVEPPPEAKPAIIVKPSPELAETPEAIVELAASFDGGTCFRADDEKVTPTSANFVTYSATKTTPLAFYEFLKPKLKFDPDIRVQMVSPAQCAVLDAMAKYRSINVTPLALAANEQLIRASNLAQGMRGDPLTVKISGVENRKLDVFLIDDAGRVQNLQQTCSSCFSHDASGDYTFSTALNALPPRRKDGGPEQHPILLLAVAGDGEIKLPPQEIAGDVDQAMEAIFKASNARTNATASINYFKLESTQK
jgi:Protein kinase domain